MRAREISACTLLHKLKNSRMVIFGAGKKLEGTFLRFKGYHFEKYVDYIVDNNQETWDTVKTLGGIKVTVHSPEYMRNHISRKTIIVIMIKQYVEVEKQLDGYAELRHNIVYRCPEYYYLLEKKMDALIAKLSLRNTVMFQGEGDNRENALALSEYMSEHGLLKKYKIVWICNHPNNFTHARHVAYIDRHFYDKIPNLLDIWKDKYYHNTARYLYYENHGIPKKRDEQIAVYLKHGTFMLKNVKGKLCIPEEVVGAICTSRNYVDLASEQESISKDKLIICGSPRLDFLYKRKDVLQTLGKWEPDKKYILWLPTLRQSKHVQRNDVKHTAPLGIPLIKSKEELGILDKYLGEMGVKLVIKPHPHQDLSVYKVDNYKNIVFLPQDMLDRYDFTIHSLMRETDALISDYSSIAFDYMLLDRPIAYTVDDMEDYLMGFSVDNPFDYMPGEKLYSYEDMLQFINGVKSETDLYAEQRRKVRDYIHEYQDDKNCERFLRIMGML
ncbi:MAG: CDP-glycerol glycerophosphotransferase family protein [Clostridiales bacterium]|nr:CDP-glycerol glycerophosphotransferase family protein [Clostridiales bacterium]